MSDRTVIGDLAAFPITGKALGQLIALFPSQFTWIVESLETLADKPNDPLQELISNLQRGPVLLSTEMLSEAIGSADQVITLAVKVQGDDESTISVDDGDFLALSLTAKARR